MVGIMQPYFFPYIGYFQLIHAVDTYVNLDHVAFMKRSWMTRNSLRNGVRVGVRVWGASQNKRCSEVLVNFSNNYVNEFTTTLHHLYSKEQQYEQIMQSIILPEFVEREVSISEFNFSIIKRICTYLNIQKTFIDTSHVFNTGDLKKEHALKFIVKELGDNRYVNAIGGQSLYHKDDFLKDGIRLHFVNTSQLNLDNKYASILDLLFRYEKEHLQEQVTRYELI